jgi:hypothetical protein
MLPSLSSNPSSFDMDHSYKTPPLSPLRTPLPLPSSSSITHIPLLPPPFETSNKDESFTITLSNHEPLLVSTTPTSTSASSHKMDHPLHPRYLPTVAATTIVPLVAPVAIKTIAPLPSPLSSAISHAHKDEKYPLVHGMVPSSSKDDIENGSTASPLSPTSAILAAIGDRPTPPVVPSSLPPNGKHHSGGHHRVLSSSSDMTSIDVSSSSTSPSPPSPTMANVLSRVGANGASFANFRLPEGDLQASDIEAIVQLVAAGNYFVLTFR